MAQALGESDQLMSKRYYLVKWASSRLTLPARGRRITSLCMSATPSQTACLLAEQLVHLARLAQGASDTSLTPAQWTALRYFARANRFSRTPSAFSDFHATTRGTASQTVKSLVAMGLLARCANAADGRSALIEVTEAGRAMLARDPLADLEACIAGLPAEGRAALGQALAHLAPALARRRAAPTFGPCDSCAHCDTTQPGPAWCRCTQSLLDQAEMGALCADFAPVLRP
jgi:DNA-binding MarR family transcriptional regulator